MKLDEIKRFRKQTDIQINNKFNQAVKQAISDNIPISTSLKDYLKKYRLSMNDVKRAVHAIQTETPSYVLHKAWEDEQYRQMFRAEQRIEDGHIVEPNQFFTIDNSAHDSAKLIATKNPF